jgi:hypothetical protein
VDSLWPAKYQSFPSRQACRCITRSDFTSGNWAHVSRASGNWFMLPEHQSPEWIPSLVIRRNRNVQVSLGAQPVKRLVSKHSPRDLTHSQLILAAACATGATLSTCQNYERVMHAFKERYMSPMPPLGAVLQSCPFLQIQCAGASPGMPCNWCSHQNIACTVTREQQKRVPKRCAFPEMPSNCA